MVELELNATALPHGTLVGAWRVYGIQGSGAYGTVYRTLREDGARTVHAALKLAIHPGDPRFEREVALLSRVRHPSVPRLLDSGLWRDLAGRSHPFLVMEWIEGGPLYEWASRRNPSSRQVLALLAQAARALEATHTVGGVHRDVKGDNMLVRPADGRLFLVDFGTGYLAGASRLTPVHVLPGTPHYRSPQVWDGVRPEGPNATSSTLARPADDVFALGVTAYRLVTDTYVPLTNPHMEPGQCWRPGGGGVRPSSQLNSRVEARLDALISRMLALEPEKRGTAGALAAELEQAAEEAGPSADEPLFEWETLKPEEWTEQEHNEAEWLGHRPRRRSRKRVLESEQADAAARAEAEQAKVRVPAYPTGTARQMKPRRWLPWLAAVLALGLRPSGTSLLHTEAVQDSSELATDGTDQEVLPFEVPKQPLPGQLKPDASGRCRTKQVVINGGCWLRLDLELDQCLGNGFVHRDNCYMPIYAPRRQPTAAPGDDGP